MVHLFQVLVLQFLASFLLIDIHSNTMDTDFCVAALEEALSRGRSEIFNTDQGSQFKVDPILKTA